MKNNDFLSGYKKYNPTEEGYGDSWSWRKAFYQRLSPDEAKRILNEKDPYEILGIRHNATIEDIKKAYKREAMKWHPDRNPDNLEYATKRMQLINAAYCLLVK